MCQKIMLIMENTAIFTNFDEATAYAGRRWMDSEILRAGSQQDRLDGNVW